MPTFPNPYQNAEFERYLANNNPYAPMTTLYGSPNAPVAKTFADLQAGGNWANSQRNNAAAMINSPGGVYRPGGAWNPAGGKASPWQSPPIAPGQTAPSVAGQEANPFSVVSNPKNTEIKSLLDKVLAQSSASMDADLNKNPYSLYTNTKDQAQASDIAGARNRFGQATAQTQQQLADFTRDYLAGNAQAKQFADQETGSIGEYYSGGVQSNLDRLARERQMAVARTTERALDRARGSLNSQRMLSGDSSRLQSQYLNTLTDVMANEARQQADLNRANYLTVRGGQDAMAGRRQQLLDNSLARGLVPLNASYAQSAAELGQLGALGNLTGQNSIYNQDTPESRMMRQLGVVGAASDIDRANTFYNLQRPYEPDFSGYAYNSPRGVTGGGYPVGPGSGDGYYEPDFGDSLNMQRQAPPPMLRRQGNYQFQNFTPYGPGGGGSGYMGDAASGYDLYGSTPYGDPNSQFYYPGYDPAQVARDQAYYE